MNITKWMRSENSGLARTTLELAKATSDLGHMVCIRQPSDGMPIWRPSDIIDLHTVHSQIHPNYYHDGKPKLMFCHGEGLSSVGNNISMRAIVDLAPILQAMICMRTEEWSTWNSIKKTYVVDKGIDLEQYYPLPGITERLSGNPAVLYYENWRGTRNPLFICIAMQEVHKKFPQARLHLYNCTDKKMHDTFKALIDNNKWHTFIRSLQGPVDDVNLLLNRVDIVASGLFPLYARSIEAFGAGKGFICPGYREHEYPFQCELSPESIASAIIKLWENRDQVDFRSWAEKYHDVKNTVKQCVNIYEKFI